MSKKTESEENHLKAMAELWPELHAWQRKLILNTATRYALQKNNGIPYCECNLCKKKKYTLVVVVVLLACICVVSIGLTWTFWDSGPQTADDYASQYGGNVDVYAQILASNDCAWLQGQFDNAYATSQANAPGTVHHKRATGFMTASNTRMEEIGCYK